MKKQKTEQRSYHAKHTSNLDHCGCSDVHHHYLANKSAEAKGPRAVLANLTELQEPMQQIEPSYDDAFPDEYDGLLDDGNITGVDNNDDFDSDDLDIDDLDIDVDIGGL